MQRAMFQKSSNSGTSQVGRMVYLVGCIILPLALAFAVLYATVVHAATLPPGFQESVAFSGLVNPMTFRFAPNGQIFVAEKSGLIKVFDNMSDTTPTIFADLRTNVYNFWDRGLLGMTLDPAYPT